MKLWVKLLILALAILVVFLFIEFNPFGMVSAPKLNISTGGAMWKPFVAGVRFDVVSNCSDFRECDSSTESVAWIQDPDWTTDDEDFYWILAFRITKDSKVKFIADVRTNGTDTNITIFRVVPMATQDNIRCILDRQNSNPLYAGTTTSARAFGVASVQSLDKGIYIMKISSNNKMDNNFAPVLWLTGYIQGHVKSLSASDYDDLMKLTLLRDVIDSKTCVSISVSDNSMTCESGNSNGPICCAAGCTICGGPGCGQGQDADDTVENCCSVSIKASNKSCADNDPPCILY